MNRPTPAFSNHWKCARSRLPTVGSLLLLTSLLMGVTGCGTPKPAAASAGDAQIAASAKAAQVAYASGGFHRAARYYERALARARALDDGMETGRNAYNAAACWLRAGDPAAALPLLVEAEREFALHGLGIDPVLVLRAEAQAALGRGTEAVAIASNALAAARSDAAQVDALLLQFDLAMGRGDRAGAASLVKAARRRADNLKSAGVESRVAAAEGRLLVTGGDPAGAAARFDVAAAGCREAGDLRGLAGNLRAAGEAFAAAKRDAEAADRLYRAARSFFGQNDNVAALQCVERAMKAAETTGDAAAREQIAALFAQIKKAVEGPAE